MTANTELSKGSIRPGLLMKCIQQFSEGVTDTVTPFCYLRDQPTT